MQDRKRIVILGAGFGGLWAARELSGADADVLVIDRNNYHTFFPLLYQVAAAEVGVDEITAPVRKVLTDYRNADFSMDYVRHVDLERKIVRTGNREIPYDYLVMSLGSRPFYFGIPGAAEHSFPLKDIEQAVALRNHILNRFEQAEHEPDAGRRAAMLTFVIVGGGPTGVEFAGALAELVHGPIRRDHRRLDMAQVRIVLLEALPSLLRTFGPELSDYTAKRLKEMGVEVRVNSAVEQVTPETVVLKDGETLASQTTVWTAGVRAEPTGESSGLPIARGGQVVVTPTLQAEGHPEVYVIGDQTRIRVGGSPLPQLAPVAIQQGTCAARNIKRQMNGQEPLAFRYHDRGAMVTIGRNHAVATILGRSFTGLPAWLLWVGVHIWNLIGFRNRFAVMMNWGMDYFFGEREVRLIIPGQAEPMRGAIPLKQEEIKAGPAPLDRTEQRIFE